MKTNYFLFLGIVICLISGINQKSVANEQYYNIIHVPTAGTLSTVLTTEQRDTITSLKLTGFMNSNTSSSGDFRTLRNMPNLQHLDISEVTVDNNTIPGDALRGKTLLKSVILPNSIEIINTYAFYGCTALSSITIPPGLLQINQSAFENCTALSGKITFPLTLKTLGSTAFRSSGVTEVEFSTGLKTIGTEAFRYCYSLTKITFDEGLESIGNSAFHNCTALNTPVRFPSSITAISNGAFYDCSALPEISFTNGTNDLNIEANAFRNCVLLNKITFAEGLKAIGDHAFRGCIGLNTPVFFPSSLISISNSTFYECTTLPEISFSNTNELSIGSATFQNCTSLTKVTFAEGLKTIGENAFRNCNKLIGELQLPASLTTIANSVFYDCNFSACRIEAETPPSVSNSEFLGRIRTVYVPEGSINAYKAATHWSGKNIVSSGAMIEYTANVTTPGTLGEQLLAQTSYLRDINILKITGTLNSADFYHIRNDLVNLIQIDLSACTNTELPDDLFYGRSTLQEIKLPLQLKKIGTNCFRECYALSTPDFPETLEEIGIRGFYVCYNLDAVVLPNSVTTIGDWAFEECRNMKSIVLSENLQAISNYMLMYCHSLEEVVIPNSVQSIGVYAFRDCVALQRVVIPDHISVIRESTFESCRSLSTIDLPSTLTTIGSRAFLNCTSLVDPVLPDKLTTIGERGFAGCSSIEHITFPAGLTKVGTDGYYYYGAFIHCSGLKEIVCLQPTPPALLTDQFGEFDKSKCDLIVPFWAEINYKLADYWKLFPNIRTHNEELSYLPISGALVFAQNLRPLGEPEVRLESTGSLSVRGNAPFHSSIFTIKHYLSDSYTGNYQYSQLVSECNSMTTDSAVIVTSMYGNRWYYLSFPFDVAMRDVQIDTDAQYVFREYDGASRASAGIGNSWKNISTGDTLKAGKGYIFQCSRSVNNLILPATTLTKNNLFFSSAKTVEVKEYISDNAADENWNLLGNPFPSYFDIRCMDIAIPITIWNGNGYTALSPVDDKYLLKPMEAFFIQKPNDLEGIIFNTEGRQTTSEILTRSSLRNDGETSRVLLNLNLSNENFMDKSRVVINPEAKATYETNCDAAKFMSTELRVPQLYSLDGNSTTYAINERPLADGIVPLGYYAGSEGKYTISLAETVSEFNVELIDKVLNETINLNLYNHAFNSESGNFNDRFELRLTTKPTGFDNPEMLATSVFAKEKQIHIEAETGNEISVYDISGKKLYHVTTGHTETIIPIITQGIFVVKVGSDTFKVVVY